MSSAAPLNSRPGEALAGGAVDPDAVQQAARYLAAAPAALRAMYLPGKPGFAQTARRGADGQLVIEGSNLRYGAIAALGLARAPEATQREVLRGSSAVDLARALVAPAAESSDTGAAALAAWAAAEVDGALPPVLSERLTGAVAAGRPAATVDYAWMLTALLAAADAADRGAGGRPAGSRDGAGRNGPREDARLMDLADAAARRLMSAQGPGGVFPHALPRESLGRLRAHVGCFADQVYPIQALARYHARTGSAQALESAARCAAAIVRLQGEAGQWWWHYDVRTASVVEGFPVYSVHQHAMAPMALHDLARAGGPDHRTAVTLGLSWIETHPETADPLVDAATGAIWRKVGRREPRKAARAVRSATTALRPGLRLSVLDRVLPPGPVDRECRPYELGWLLYAWLPEPGAAP